MTVLLAAVTAVLFSTGAWLLMQRRLSRIIIGIGLLGHGANLLLVTAGGPGGNPPILDGVDPTTVSDPMPQALALTAIVITFGITALVLALGFRRWQITGDDRVEDDVEDRRIDRIAQTEGEAPDDEESSELGSRPEAPA